MSSTKVQMPSRRESEPHSHHQHRQPRYPEEYRPRRHTYDDGSKLTKVHSRPEDYKNRKPTGKLVEYLCFDGEGHPQECDEVNEQEQHKNKQPEDTPLDRYNSNSSHCTTSTTHDSDYDGDSEEELTLPSTYQHDMASRDPDAWPSKYNSRTRRGSSASPARYEGQHEDPCAHHRHTRSRPQATQRTEQPDTRTSPVRRRRDDSRTPSLSPSSSTSQHRPVEHPSTGSEKEDNILAQVVHHLQAHKDEYMHTGNAKDVVSQLLGEVVRKVEDGDLDGKLMREVVREVQHVL